MKTNFTLNPIITLCLLAGLMLAQPAFAIGKPFKKYAITINNEPVEEKAIKKEKARVKAFSSRNNSSVKIYPDIIKREMHVVAKENEGKNVDFFGDEETASGKFEIR